MSWPTWPGTAPPMPSAVASTLIPGTINSAPAVMPTSMQYSPEQWAQAQQQNWQQWATWQQQFQQWQQRYGAEYQSAMQGMTASGAQPPLPTMAAPSIAPPLPTDKPPLPPEEPPASGATAAPTPVQPPAAAAANAYATLPPNMATYGGYNTAPVNNKSMGGQSWPQKRPHAPDQMGDYGKKKPAENNSYQWPQAALNPWPQRQQQQQQQHFSQPPPVIQKPNVEELSEAEKKFDKEFAAWEAQFNKWKEQNANHPDKTQYREYEKKWESWRNSLLERREQMRKKRLALAAASSKPDATPSLTSQPPPLMGMPPPTAVQAQAPQQNNEPLAFKQAPSTSNFPESSTSFLSSSTTGGIPGLDLVKDDKEATNNNQEDVDESQGPKKYTETKSTTQKGPDLDAISKGINNILGDQKLLSMLSMVSQNQSTYSSSQTNSTSAMGYGQARPGGNYNAPPPCHNEPPMATSLNDSKSNQSYEDRFGHDQDYYRQQQRETVNNFDDQTRSSFTMGPGDQEQGMRNRNAPPPQQQLKGLPESDRFLIRNSFAGNNRPSFDKDDPPNNFRQQQQQRGGFNDCFQDKEDKFGGRGNNRPSGGNFGNRGIDRNNSYDYDDYENEEDFDRYHDMFRDDEVGQYNDGGHYDDRSGYDNCGQYDGRDRYEDGGRYDDRRDEGRYMQQDRGGFKQRASMPLVPAVKEPVAPVTAPPKIQPLMQLNFEPPPQLPVEEPEEELFEPTTVIDYDHKSKYTVEIEVTVEPFYTFDYRHKPVNRIPFPQRPKWLIESTKSIREFDPLASISTLQKYERSFYDRPEVERREDRYVRPRYDDRYHRDVDRMGPVRRDDRQGPEYNRRAPPDSRRDGNHDLRRDGPNDSRRDGPNDSKRDGTNEFRRDSNRNEDRYRRRSEECQQRNMKNDFEELSDEDMEWERDDDRRDQQLGRGKDSPQQQSGSNVPPPHAVSKETMIDDILNPPGRFNRPARIVIILRGPPGSGKTYLAKLIKDKEVENGGSAPRILSLDDYFMVEQEKEVFEDGKRQKVKEMVYEYEADMEESYRASFIKSFKKTITDGYFPFIIVDNINDKVKYFGEMWSFAKQNGFQVYICQMDLDPVLCAKRNIHNRSEKEIEDCISGWEPTPDHHPVLDASSLLQASGIVEVEMEDEQSAENTEDGAGVEDVARSKWDTFDCSYNSLAKLDGVSKPLRKSETMAEFLQMEDEWEPVRPSKPGQKRVRWADLEEQRKQAKMRAIGFTIGTDWNSLMDPTDGSSALTQTKYIERVSRY